MDPGLCLELSYDLEASRSCIGREEECQLHFENAVYTAAFAAEIVGTGILLMTPIPGDEAIGVAAGVATQSRLQQIQARLSSLVGRVRPTLPSVGQPEFWTDDFGLRAASNAAIRAARGADGFIVSSKHLPWGGGRYSKWAEGIDYQSAIRAALTSSDALFRPGGKADRFIVVTDMGYQVGTKVRETAVKAVVAWDGRIITAYPVPTR